MDGFDYVASVSAVISFVSLMIVVFQLQEQTEQRKLESFLHLHEINRQLVSLGFATPDLFDILQGGPDADPVLERRYLQLWFNQMAVVHASQCRGLFPQELRASLERDLRDFLELENVCGHWRRYRRFYPESFQGFVDSLLPGEGGPPA